MWAASPGDKHPLLSKPIDHAGVDSKIAQPQWIPYPDIFLSRPFDYQVLEQLDRHFQSGVIWIVCALRDQAEFLAAEWKRGERSVAVKPGLHLIVRQVPIDRDIREQRTQRKGRAGKGKTGLLANDAVRAFAAHQEFRANLFLSTALMTNHRAHRIWTLAEIDQFPPSLHHVAAFCQRRLKNLLGHALGNHDQPWLAGLAPGQIRWKLHLNRKQFFRAGAQIKRSNSAKPALEKFARDSEDRENFREARLQSERL